MKRKIRLVEVAELIVVVGFVSFAVGSMLGGGKASEQHLYGENISVNVSVPKLGISKQVQLYSGMTAFDAVLKTSLKYKVDMRTAAYIVAINRVATVTRMRGMYA